LQPLGAHYHCHDLGLKLGNRKQGEAISTVCSRGTTPVSIASIVEIAVDRHDYLSESKPACHHWPG